MRTRPTLYKRKRLNSQVTEGEFQKIWEEYQQSLHPSFADFIRVRVLGKPVRVYTRNKSFDDFIGEGIRLRKEMEAIRTGVPWTAESERRLLLALSEIQFILNKINDVCTPALLPEAD